MTIIYIMGTIKPKLKETASEIYTLCIVTTDTSQKLSLLNHLYAIIKVAIKIKDKEFEYKTDFITIKKELKGSWEEMADRRAWPAAEQNATDIIEKLVEIGYIEEILEVKENLYNFTQSMMSSDDDEEES